ARLERDTSPRTVTSDNRGEAMALAAYAAYDITAFDLTLSPGIRTEYVQTTLRDDLNGATVERADHVWSPGLGAFYGVTETLGFLAGVYRGFSPVAPGQPEAIRPEESTNYEAGARFRRDNTRAEFIGFFSDYENLLGECSFSAGCTEDMLLDQFNGGRVHIFGIEAMGGHTIDAGPVTFPLRINYTFTQSSFRTSFLSDDPQWGDVGVGDELPYVPEHQVNFAAGVARPLWNVMLNAT